MNIILLQFYSIYLPRFDHRHDIFLLFLACIKFKPIYMWIRFVYIMLYVNNIDSFSMMCILTGQINYALSPIPIIILIWLLIYASIDIHKWLLLLLFCFTYTCHLNQHTLVTMNVWSNHLPSKTNGKEQANITTNDKTDSEPTICTNY